MRTPLLLLILLLAGCAGQTPEIAAGEETEPVGDAPADGAPVPVADPRVPIVTFAEGVQDLSLWHPANPHMNAGWVRANSINDVYRSPHDMAGWLLEIRTTSPVAHGTFALHLVAVENLSQYAAFTASAPVGDHGRLWVSQADYDALEGQDWFISAYTEGPAPDATVQVSWEVAISHLPEIPDDAYTSFET